MHRASIVRLLASASIALAACSRAPTDSLGTAAWAVTGVAEIQGVISDSLGARLDSVTVSVGSADSTVWLRSGPVTTGADGTYLVRVERLAERGPDSVFVQVAAFSLRPRHRQPDGSPARVVRRLWLPVAVPPASPRRVVLDVALMVTR